VIRTLKVEAAWPGANRYFVVTRRSDGSKLVDAKPWSRLTPKQKRMVTLKKQKQAA
jgi:hypothetical protein